MPITRVTETMTHVNRNAEVTQGVYKVGLEP